MSYVVTGRLEIHRQRPPVRKPAPRPRTAPRRGKRTALMLGLALRIEQEIESGTVRDLAHAAGLLGLSKPRVTQVMNLLHLAPDIQARLLAGDPSILERALREALRCADWDEQRAVLQERR